MKKSNINSRLIGIFLMIFLMGCSNFDELNTNPDTTTKVPASMECTSLIINMLGHGGDAMSYISENTLSKYVGFAVLGKNGAQYNDFGSGSFGPMTMLPNVDAMLELAKGSVMENSYKGVASFIRAYLFFRMTMWMGDIPYSEAGKGIDGVFKPKYDTQEQVLLGVLNELKAADAYFASGVKFDGDPTPYNGDPEKWRQAVNAFTLKVLISLSPKESSTTLDIKNRFAQVVAKGNLMTESTGYLGLAYTLQNPHPLFSATSMFTPKTVASSQFLNQLRNLNDRRMFYFFEPAPAQIAAGLTEDDPQAYNGVDITIDYADLNTLFKSNVLSRLNLRYSAEAACEPLMDLTYAEQQLILAEARIRGWITTGSAQEYYEQGVKAALANMLDYCDAGYAHGMAIDQNYIDAYFTGEAAFKSTANEQLKQIWLQEYILRFMQDATFSYFEYRRVKYPDFPVNPATNLNIEKPNGIPMRYLYPGSESTYNNENLVEALNRQYDGYDEVNKLMWLLK